MGFDDGLSTQTGALIFAMRSKGFEAAKENATVSAFSAAGGAPLTKAAPCGAQVAGGEAKNP